MNNNIIYLNFIKESLNLAEFRNICFNYIHTLQGICNIYLLTWKYKNIWFIIRATYVGDTFVEATLSLDLLDFACEPECPTNVEFRHPIEKGSRVPQIIINIPEYIFIEIKDYYSLLGDLNENTDVIEDAKTNKDVVCKTVESNAWTNTELIELIDK